MSTYRSKSLRELGVARGVAPGFDSRLVQRCEALYGKPLGELSVEDLRLLIGQNIGLEFLVPLAVERLRENPFVGGDYYPGDLLHSVLNIHPTYWDQHPEQYWDVYEVSGGLLPVLKDLTASVERFNLATGPARKP